MPVNDIVNFLPNLLFSTCTGRNFVRLRGGNLTCL